MKERKSYLKKLTQLLVWTDLLYLPKLLIVVNSSAPHIAPTETPQTWVGKRSGCLAGEVGHLNRGANRGSGQGSGGGDPNGELLGVWSA